MPTTKLLVEIDRGEGTPHELCGECYHPYFTDDPEDHDTHCGIWRDSETGQGPVVQVGGSLHFEECKRCLACLAAELPTPDPNALACPCGRYKFRVVRNRTGLQGTSGPMWVRDDDAPGLRYCDGCGWPFPEADEAVRLRGTETVEKGLENRAVYALATLSNMGWDVEPNGAEG